MTDRPSFDPTGPAALRRSARRLGRLPGAWIPALRLAQDRRDIRGIVAKIQPDESGTAAWTVRRSIPGEPSVIVVGPPAGPPAAVIRIAHGAVGAAGLRRAGAALEVLRTLSHGSSGAIPRTLGNGRLDDRTWSAETGLPGVAGHSLLADAVSRQRILAATVAAIGPVHAVGARHEIVSPAQIGRWVHDRSRVVADALSRARSGVEPAGLGRLVATLAADLDGRVVATGWIHGDLWLANVLVDETVLQVTGIVDWDSAEADEPPFQDLLHLALTTRRAVERRALGPVLADLLGGGGWSSDDLVVVGAGSGTPSGPDGAAQPDALDGLPIRTALWLYWLRFVAANVARHPDLATRNAWVGANVERVLACV